MTPRQESAAREHRRTRQQWKAAGLCTDCGKAKATPNQLCQKCAKKRITQQAQNRKVAQTKVAEMRRALGIVDENPDGEVFGA